MTRVEREALELAEKQCGGRYTVEHVAAWVHLEALGLICAVRAPDGAWYEITETGRVALCRHRREPQSRSG
jgi:hypothetical protein